MNINTSAWHYKIFSFIYDAFMSSYDRKHMKTMSLCPYFWWVVFGIVFAAFIIFVLCFMSFILLPAIPVFLLFAFGVIELTSDSMVEIWAVFGTVEISVALVLGLWFSGKKLLAWIKSKRKHNVKVVKPDSLVVSYIKAKKSKFCPTVTFNKD